MSSFPNIQPDYGAKLSIKEKAVSASFGDGYKQVAGDGLNTKRRVWSVSYTQTETDTDTLEAFLIEKGTSQTFDWTPPRGAAGKWRVTEDGFDRNVANFGYETVSVAFEEVFYP